MDFSPLLCTLFLFVPSSRKELEAMGEWPSKEEGYSVDFGDRAGVGQEGANCLSTMGPCCFLPLPLESTVLCFSVMAQPLRWGGVLSVCAWVWLYASFQGRERLCLPSLMCLLPCGWAKKDMREIGTPPPLCPSASASRSVSSVLWKNAKTHDVNKRTKTGWFCLVL